MWTPIMSQNVALKLPFCLLLTFTSTVLEGKRFFNKCFMLHAINASCFMPDQKKNCHSPYCQPYNSYNVSSEHLILDQLIIPQSDVFLYSHHSSGWYCIDIVRKNSVLVTHGS